MRILHLCGVLLLVVSIFAQENILPVKYNSIILEGVEMSCPAESTRNVVKATITEDVRNVIESSVLPALTGGQGTSGCVGSGWTRFAYLNMTDPTQQCPPEWNLITSPKRTCGRSTGSSCSSPSVPCTCDSAIFSNTLGMQYSQVCGRVIGYQYGRPEAFGVYPHLKEDIDRAYAEGVSITYGSPRQHIWTFAAAQDELNTGAQVCPCTNTLNPTDISIPSFVGDDYFCETGVPPGSGVSSSVFYSSDPLWDGDGCGTTSTCCVFNTPPWFHKELPQPTTDDIEVRLCGDFAVSDEDFPIELIDIYVK